MFISGALESREILIILINSMQSKDTRNFINNIPEWLILLLDNLDFICSVGTLFMAW